MRDGDYILQLSWGGGRKKKNDRAAIYGSDLYSRAPTIDTPILVDHNIIWPYLEMLKH